MARPRSRSVSRFGEPWAFNNSPRHTRKACVPMHSASQQDWRLRRPWATGSRKQHEDWKIATNTIGVGRLMKPNAFRKHAAGLFVVPLSGPMPAPVYLFNNGNMVFLSQRHKVRKQARRRRRSTRPRKGHAQKPRSQDDEVVYICPPAPLLTNEFYMRRAEEERAAAAAAQQMQPELLELCCPPAPLLTNEYYMQRAQLERAAAQQQLQAAEYQAATEIVEPQQHQPCMSQLQLPSTPSVIEQQLCSLFSLSGDSEQPDCALHSSAASAVSCSSREHTVQSSRALEGHSQHVSWQSPSIAAEEEVCTWDPEALVVVESF